jgi:hypothetical protein
MPPAELASDPRLSVLTSRLKGGVLKATIVSVLARGT